jgi:hypothetical protein
MEWTIASDLQLSDATGHRIATLPGKTTSYSYTTDSWYFGVFAWVFIAAVIGHGIYMPMDPANGGRPQFISDRGEMEAASLLCAIRESLPPFA